MDFCSTRHGMWYNRGDCLVIGFSIVRPMRRGMGGCTATDPSPTVVVSRTLLPSSVPVSNDSEDGDTTSARTEKTSSDMFQTKLIYTLNNQTTGGDGGGDRSAGSLWFQGPPYVDPPKLASHGEWKPRRAIKRAGHENQRQIPLVFFHVVSISIHSWALFNACNASNDLPLG